MGKVIERVRIWNSWPGEEKRERKAQGQGRTHDPRAPGRRRLLAGDDLERRAFPLQQTMHLYAIPLTRGSHNCDHLHCTTGLDARIVPKVQLLVAFGQESRPSARALPVPYSPHAPE